MTLVRDGRAHWSIEAHLLDELRMLWTEKPKPHPQRPRLHAKQPTPERRAKLAAARHRAADRRRRLAQREDP